MPDLTITSYFQEKKVDPLRYPVSQIEEDTDFLQIKVVKYQAPGFEGSQFEQPTSSNTVAENIETPIATIFLPIPENIQDSNAVNWGEDSLNGLAARGIGLSAAAIGSNEGFVETAAGFLTGAGAFAEDLTGISAGIRNSFIAAKAVGQFTNVNAQGVVTRQTGQIVNPNMELLFNNVTLRSFNFQFDLAPRDKTESIVIKNIIRIFKRSMNAKKNGTGSSNIEDESRGLFISSPDVFQLSYKTGGNDHKFLNKFKPMALLNMAVNYTGSGTYATYDDTTPVHMQLSLQFQELNPIYAEDYNTLTEEDGVGF
tara:strand:+ start:481 stop:1416 length:936 start_codon:yes stop_codon:yes gene_type:complete